jgi:hypothetical protein
VLIPIFILSEFAQRHPAIILAFVGLGGKGYEVLAKYFFKIWYTKFDAEHDAVGVVFWVVAVLGVAWGAITTVTSENRAAQKDLEVKRTINRLSERTLSASDQERMAAELSKWSNTVACIEGVQSDAYSEQMRDQISWVLVKAGWKMTTCGRSIFPTGFGDEMKVLDEGVAVAFQCGHPVSFPNEFGAKVRRNAAAGWALISSLSERGIVVQNRFSGGNVEVIYPFTIFVRVGRYPSHFGKPLPHPYGKIEGPFEPEVKPDD